MKVFLFFFIDTLRSVCHNEYVARLRGLKLLFYLYFTRRANNRPWIEIIVLFIMEMRSGRAARSSFSFAHVKHLLNKVIKWYIMLQKL